MKQISQLTLTAWLAIFLVSEIAVAQNGQYDMRLVLDHVDCINSKVYFDVEVRASSDTNTFIVADQHYRMSFTSSSALPNSATIEEELCLSGFVTHYLPSTLSFFSPHNLLGSADTVISLNVTLAGGDGYFVGHSGMPECGFSSGDGWVPVSRLSLQMADNLGSVTITPHDDFVFPPTVVIEKFAGILYSTVGSAYHPLYVSLLNECSSLVINEVVTVQPSCAGGSNASIAIDASSGIPPLQYSINNGASFQSSNAFSGLSAGTYNVVVEDATGAQKTSIATITEPTPITSSISVARCGSYTVPSGDETHTTSGVYMDTIPSANGCDSVLTINVHIDEVPTLTNFTGREVDQFRVRWEYLLPVTINDTNFRIRAWESGFPGAYTDKSQFPGNFQKKFTGLDDNTWYKVKVGFACEDGSFVWSGTDSVRTRKIPCPDVTGQTQVLPYAAHTATVRWNDSGADSHKIRFRASGASDWRFRSVTDTSLSLAGLIVDSSYEYQVKAQCSNGLESSYGEIYNFSTQGIGVERLSTSPIEAFKAYPNPSDGNLTLEMSTEEVRGLITLTDVAGRTVYSESLMLGPNFRKAFNFEVEQGSYLLQVVSDRLIETARLEVR